MDRRDFLETLGIGVASLALPQAAGGTSLAEIAKGLSALERWHPSAELEARVNETFPVKEEELKFQIKQLERIILNHENLNLNVYPDAHGCAIGAGFNLNVGDDVLHPEPDAYQYNDRKRIDPSSKALWNMAGLDESRLTAIRDKFEQQKTHPEKIRYHSKKDSAAYHDIGDNEANALLYISTRQAIHNAMAYCGDFKNMTQAQQMSMCELSYELGSHLEKFVNFLSVVNEPTFMDAAPDIRQQKSGDHWRMAQCELVNSGWYTDPKTHRRAVDMTAMMDPEFDFKNPRVAQRKVQDMAPENPSMQALANSALTAVSKTPQI